MNVVTVIQTAVADRTEADIMIGRLDTVLQHLPNCSVTHQITDSPAGFQTDGDGKLIE